MEDISRFVVEYKEHPIQQRSTLNTRMAMYDVAEVETYYLKLMRSCLSTRKHICEKNILRHL